MTVKKNKKILIFILILVFIVLISAYIIEHVLGHLPCKLCLYERVPYILSIFLIMKILFFNDYNKITLLILSIVFFVGAIISFYHLGIEQGFFKESLACTAENFSGSITKEEILEQLEQNSISCKDVSFRIFGFSLASINTIFSFILSVIFIKLFLNYDKN